MSNSELKPCPFCGSNDVGFAELLNAVYCNGCDTAISKNPYEENEGVIKVWNTRSPDVKPVLTDVRSDLINPVIEEIEKQIECLAECHTNIVFCKEVKPQKFPVESTINDLSNVVDQLSKIRNMLQGVEG